MACDRCLATTGKGVVLRLPKSGREVGWRVPTCGLPHTSSKSVHNSRHHNALDVSIMYDVLEFLKQEGLFDESIFKER